MEKLRELLNEFDPYIAKDGEHRDNLWYTVYDNGSAIFSKGIGILVIISKEYGFIKWLVENDKIAYDRYIKEFRMKDFGKFYYMSKYEVVIANLSIQDNPIEFLISILR